MFETLSQYAEEGFWLLQAVIGLIFIVHSIGKIKNPSGVASVYHAPAFVGLLHGLVELAGGIMLIVNFHPKTVAIVFGLIMLGAIYYKTFKWKSGFMSQTTTGWEFDLLILAACVAIITAV